MPQFGLQYDFGTLFFLLLFYIFRNIFFIFIIDFRVINKVLWYPKRNNGKRKRKTGS